MKGKNFFSLRRGDIDPIYVHVSPTAYTLLKKEIRAIVPSLFYEILGGQKVFGFTEKEAYELSSGVPVADEVIVEAIKASTKYYFKPDKDAPLDTLQCVFCGSFLTAEDAVVRISRQKRDDGSEYNPKGAFWVENVWGFMKNALPKLLERVHEMESVTCKSIASQNALEEAKTNLKVARLALQRGLKNSAEIVKNGIPIGLPDNVSIIISGFEKAALMAVCAKSECRHQVPVRVGKGGEKYVQPTYPFSWAMEKWAELENAADGLPYEVLSRNARQVAEFADELDPQIKHFLGSYMPEKKPTTVSPNPKFSKERKGRKLNY